MARLFLKIFFLTALEISVSFPNSMIPIQNQQIEARQSMKAHKRTVRAHDSSKGAEVEFDYGKIPLYFIPNRGQVHEEVLFYARASRYTLWLTKKGLVFDSRSILKWRNSGSLYPDTSSMKSGDSFSCERDVSRLVFLGSRKNPKVIATAGAGHRVNYFIGNNKSKWRTNIPTSRGVLYRELYESVDLNVYGAERRIEYDYTIRPGGKVSDIKFEYENVKNTKIDKQGNLLIETEFCEFRHRKPHCYQEVDGKKALIEARFNRIADNTYGFKVERYDQNRELVIDPVVSIGSTYMGGLSHDYGHGIAVDSEGAVYVSGSTRSADFPVQNPFEASKEGMSDVFIAKLNSSGDALVYSTYLGGSDDELLFFGDYGCGIAVDSEGAVYVTGNTESTDFPTQNPFQGNKAEDSDVFIAKLSASGDSLIYSTYLGGSSLDYSRGIAVNSSGEAFVTGYTFSLDFPTSSPIQGNKSEGWDAFVTKINSFGSALVYSTYLGGSNHDYGCGIAVDSEGAAYVTGDSFSTDFPTQGPIRANNGGLSDAFIAKLNSQGSALVYSTYLGGSNYDYGCGIAVDALGAAYVTGSTRSSDFPVQNPMQESNAEGYDVFVTEINSSGDAFIYSTYLGGSSHDCSHGIAVDSAGAAYVTGCTLSIDFPTQGAVYETYAGGESYDSFVSKIKASGDILSFSTYLGGSDDDFGKAIIIDSSGAARVTGYTHSTDFPTVDPLYGTQAGEWDVFIAKLSFAYSLTINAGANGTTQPAPGTYTHNAGTEVSIEASPAQGYNFNSWTGDVPSGHENDNPLTITMNSDKSLTANFTEEYILTIAADAGGTTNPAPGTHSYGGGEVTITANPSEGYRFSGWTGDVPSGHENDNPLTVTMDSNKSITANFIRQYTLTITTTEGGTTDPSPGIYVYDVGTEITIKAIPDSDYKFSGWSGDASGEENPTVISMDSDKTVTANFIRIIYSPLNFKGKKISNRALFYIEYINSLSWDANPKNADIGVAKYRICQGEGGSRSLLVELDADTFNYYHRRVDKDKSYVYTLVAVNSEGVEGEPATITVQ
jgi:hypothetical protein